MVAVLDILQSIPVLSFLPPVVLAMVALVPGHQLGIEMGVILLIFTGQVWNLAFSFYSSLKSIPREMIEASRIYRYSAWQRFWQLEMPYAAIGLVWNSIVSVAGGWFALIVLRNVHHGRPQLPVARPRQLHPDRHLLPATCAPSLAGIAAVILIVVATDQLVWRPLIAWSDKFKFEQVESADRVTSPILELLRRSSSAQSPSRPHLDRVEEPIYRRLAQHQGMPRRAARSTKTQRRQMLRRHSGRLPLPRSCVVAWGAAAGRPHASHRHLARPAPAA